MGDTMSYVNIVADGAKSYQAIDGFGVNINSKYWGSEGFLKAMSLLVDDLGATLYRVDIWGKSNWVDPTSEEDSRVLNQETYAEVYQGEVFRRGWAMMRYLNQHGIEPYLTASGDVPAWMLGDDGKTLVQYEAFCEMLVSMVEWARKREGLLFKYVGPLNETDIGSPEGPSVSPQAFAQIARLLHDKLAHRNLDDIRLVVAEQAMLNTDYVNELIDDGALENRIGVFGVHSYFDYPVETYREIVDLVQSSPCAGASVWLSEYGDLEQTGEKEWFVAWVSTRRLLDALEAGFNGAMVWDAYDNYHDHNEFWTIYGLMRTGLGVFTPKKRYYAAKQVYRYVLPGFQRIKVESDSDDLRILGFSDPARTAITLVGMNVSASGRYINVALKGLDANLLAGRVGYYRTTESEDCVKVGEKDATSSNFPYTGLAVFVPAHSIFTLTSVG